MVNPFNHPNDSPKPDGVHGFQDSEAEHTPLNADGLQSKLAQNKATVQGPHGSPAMIHNYPPPGGREAVDGGLHASATESGIQHAREGGRSFTGTQTKGKVLISGNHPNKNLKNLYG